MDIESLTPETADSFADVSTTSTESEGFDSSFSEVNTPQMSHRDQSVEPPPPITVEESCNVMMEKIADYLNCELSATSNDYKLLETLNKLAVDKYSEMSTTTSSLIDNMEKINERYKALEPYLRQVDLLEESVLKLEQTAYKLDSYSKQIETTFKNMEKR